MHKSATNLESLYDLKDDGAEAAVSLANQKAIPSTLAFMESSSSSVCKTRTRGRRGREEDEDEMPDSHRPCIGMDGSLPKVEQQACRELETMRTTEWSTSLLTCCTKKRNVQAQLAVAAE